MTRSVSPSSSGTARTTYRVRDERGVVVETTDADRAARLSRAGLLVTAVTEGQR